MIIIIIIIIIIIHRDCSIEGMPTLMSQDSRINRPVVSFSRSPVVVKNSLLLYNSCLVVDARVGCSRVRYIQKFLVLSIEYTLQYKEIII